MTGEEATADITREKWVDLYNEGFTLGQRERRKQTQNRRSKVENVLDDAEDHQPPELEALQEGYDLGLKKGLPGSNLDVDQKANNAFDRSGYAADLSQWSE